MSKSSSVPWWSSLGFGKAEPTKDTDYGDMGTAFGMEQWLDERDQGAMPSGTARGRRSWLPRWLQGTGPR